ncbi:histidine kinase [Carboxylicivirga sp. A043]|uniref:sensor histidine kinase n=1 Tax=Carboxylicivirga litoralis TaxID=2816963 RepID=UPI0021CAE99B|nr:histidine kinase [Carboxylicivirga sp. A043]MCU4155841.1 histidine kinase [Carboxylicivirga sp. A043]
MMKLSKNRSLTFTLHVLAWLVLVILPQLIINRYWGNQNFIAWGFYLNAAIYGVIFYINYLLLVPELFFKKRKIVYFLGAITTIAVFYVVMYYLNEWFLHDPEKERKFAEAMDRLAKENILPKPPLRQLQVYYYILTSTIVSSFAFGLKVIEKHVASEKKQKELEKEKLNSELAFLKNQVSPHFFFNTLNNIYALIGISAPEGQKSVLKLSKLMRYLLYDSENGLTELKQEVVFLNHYIDLMRLRVSPKVEFKIDLPEEHLTVEIPPLLFIPFIENAFKHGISYRENSFIHIKMEVDNKVLQFSCVNSISKTPETKLTEKHSGIGLENVRKRLQLLYPDKHRLTIDNTNTEFKVELSIELNESL